MHQYKHLLAKVIKEGVVKENRTGVNTIGIIGAHMQFEMSAGFPMVTLKRTYWKQSIAEMLGFLRGESDSQAFRELGCTVWDQNANENKNWLENSHRMGYDDLGSIYGVQAREWPGRGEGHIDQLWKVYCDLNQGIDDRREIVSHWNPADMAHIDNTGQKHESKMALPPCHLLYQFSIQGDELHLTMYQRSCDMALGVPFNIVGYSWLLMVMAQITGLKAGTFNHFLTDVHIYENHLEGVKLMLQRDPLPLPTMHINPAIKTLEDLETWVTIDDFELQGYQHHPAIKLEMAV